MEGVEFGCFTFSFRVLKVLLKNKVRHSVERISLLTKLDKENAFTKITKGKINIGDDSTTKLSFKP